LSAGVELNPSCKLERLPYLKITQKTLTGKKILWVKRLLQHRCNYK